jgi:hypothetical protein
MRRHSTLIAISIAILTTAITSRTDRALADDELRHHLKPVVMQIADYLKRNDAATVAVSRFTGPHHFPSTNGEGIREILSQEFKKLGIAVKGRSRYAVFGEFKQTEAPHPNPFLAKEYNLTTVALEITVKVSEFGKETPLVPLNVPPLTVSDPRTNRQETIGGLKAGIGTVTVKSLPLLASMLGATVELPAGVPGQQRNKRFLDGLLSEKPCIGVVKHQQESLENSIAAKADSPFAIQIIKRGMSVKPIVEDGTIAVPLLINDIYAINIINNANFDVAARISIDGLSVFAFDKRNDFEYFIIPRNETRLIEGWFNPDAKNGNFELFQIGTLAESAVAERLEGDKDVGAVTVSFAAAWAEGEPAPADEYEFRQMLNRNEPIATKRGPVVSRDVSTVFRHVGVLRAAITVRYGK